MNQNKIKGFTLVELMVTIAIMAIMAAIALPNMRDFVASSRIKNRAEQTAALFRFAKGEAARLNMPVVVCGVTIRSDGRDTGACNANNYGSGMLAFGDQNRNGTYENTDVRLRTVSINGNRNNDAQVRIELGNCGLLGACAASGNNNSRVFVFMPDGRFGERRANAAAVTAANYMGQFDFSGRSLRVALSDADLAADDTRHRRYVVVSPTGMVSVCSHGGETADNNTGVCQ